MKGLFVNAFVILSMVGNGEIMPVLMIVFVVFLIDMAFKYYRKKRDEFTTEVVKRNFAQWKKNNWLQ